MVHGKVHYYRVGGSQVGKSVAVDANTLGSRFAYGFLSSGQ